MVYAQGEESQSNKRMKFNGNSLLAEFIIPGALFNFIYMIC